MASPSPVLETQSVIVRGASMEPLLKNGQMVNVAPVDCTDKTQKHSCPAFKHGDIVVFDSAAHKRSPVIKQIAGVPGDVLELAPDGRILVNGLPAPAPSGKPYIAPARARKMIALYEGKIPENAFLVLGNPGSLDAGRFGLISREQIVGIVVK